MVILYSKSFFTSAKSEKTYSDSPVFYSILYILCRESHESIATPTRLLSIFHVTKHSTTPNDNFILLLKIKAKSISYRVSYHGYTL